MSGAGPPPRQEHVEHLVAQPTGQDDPEAVNDPSWGHIENEGALFRGPSRHLPRIIWSSRDKRWRKYTGPCPARSYTWGYDITAAEAQELMSGDW